MVIPLEYPKMGLCVQGAASTLEKDALAHHLECMRVQGSAAEQLQNSYNAISFVA